MKELIEKAKDLCATAEIKIKKAELQREEQDRREADIVSRQLACKVEEDRLREAGVLEKSIAWVTDQIAILNGRSNEFSNDKIVWERTRTAKEKELDDLIAQNKELQSQYDGRMEDLYKGQEALEKDKREYQSKIIEDVNKRLAIRGIRL